MRVRRIYFSHAVTVKLWRKHGLEPDEIEEAIINSDETLRQWDDSLVHGHRLLVKTHLQDGRKLFASLTPIDFWNGIYKCITAFVPEREDYQ